MDKTYRLNHSLDLDPLIQRVGDAKVVLLGEASHGTHEYYIWRAAITRRLIEEKGFDFIAVEGDWPDCFHINRYIKHHESPEITSPDVLKRFKRWPTWMWGNWEIAAFADYLKLFNQNNFHKKHPVGFYGLDVYSLWESLEAIHDYYKNKNLPGSEIIEKAIDCFSGYNKEGHEYARAILSMDADCSTEVKELLKHIRLKSDQFEKGFESELNLEVNALVAKNAEAYYTSMISFNDDSWNVRDKHMAEVLDLLLNVHGKDSKAVIWEHNTHIGDARATSMRKEGLLNVGQLVREKYGEHNCVLVGFATYEGTVIAGSNWGAPMQIMEVPPAKEGSIENYLHQNSSEDRLLIFNKDADPVFQRYAGHRAIGVVYHPGRERGNYVPSILSQRYDAMIYIDETSALHPIYNKPDKDLIPETYPFNI